MITFSIIQKSQLEGAHRLDAEYYQSEYLELVLRIASRQSKPLGDLVETIKHPAEIKRTYEDSGVPFLLTQNISSVYTLQFEEKRFISRKDADLISQNQLKNGDVIMTRTGVNYGDAAIYLAEPQELFASAHVLIIRPKGITGEFLVAYLNSRVGRPLIKRGMYGTSQPEISPEYLKTLLIPIPNEDNNSEIVKLVSSANQELKSSKSLYSQAESLLLEELGLKDFQIEDDLFFIVNLSDVKSARRADAEHFQPKYKNLEARIKKYGTQNVTDIIENVPARFKPKQDENYRYVELANINSSLGIIDGSSEILGKDAPSRAKRILKDGDVIVSSVEGSLEKTALVNKEQEGYLASTGFFQFRSKEILQEVLLVLVKSFVFQMQLQKQTTGTILSAVPKEAVKNLLIPILSQSVQQQIANLIRKAHEAKKKSKQLLEETKSKVEEMIEKESCR